VFPTPLKVIISSYLHHLSNYLISSAAGRGVRNGPFTGTYHFSISLPLHSVDELPIIAITSMRRNFTLSAGYAIWPYAKTRPADWQSGSNLSHAACIMQRNGGIAWVGMLLESVSTG